MRHRRAPRRLRLDGSPGTTPGQFTQPRGVSVDGRGDGYVVEFGAGRVQRFTRSYLEAL